MRSSHGEILDGIMGREVHFNDKASHEDATTDRPVGRIIGWYVDGGIRFLIESGGHMHNRAATRVIFKDWK